MLGSYSIMRSDSNISDVPAGDSPPKEQDANPKEGEDIPKENEDSLLSTEPVHPRLNRWTNEEVERLVSLRAQFPDMPWEELQATYFPDRTIPGIKGKIWRIEEAGARAQKRTRSESSGVDDFDGEDIPFEGIPGGERENLGINPSGETAPTPRLSSRNPNPPRSTTKLVLTGFQTRKSTRNSLPTTASFSPPVNNPPQKKVRKSSVQLPDNHAPPIRKTDEGGNTVQLALQLLDPKLWSHIYDEARQCEFERRRANKAHDEKAALEEELDDLKSRLRKMDQSIHNPKGNPSTRQSPAKELDLRRAQRLKSAWATVTNTCKDSISFSNWEGAGMSEAMKVVQGEIDEMTKTGGSEPPLSSPPVGMVNGREHEDTGDSVMGNF